LKTNKGEKKRKRFSFCFRKRQGGYLEALPNGAPTLPNNKRCQNIDATAFLQILNAKTQMQQKDNCFNEKEREYAELVSLVRNQIKDIKDGTFIMLLKNDLFRKTANDWDFGYSIDTNDISILSLDRTSLPSYNNTILIAVDVSRHDTMSTPIANTIMKYSFTQNKLILKDIKLNNVRDEY